MSRSNRRPTSNSRGSSSSGHRALSVTEAVQSIRLTETVGEQPVGPRRPSSRNAPSAYEQSPYQSSPYAVSTLDPSVLDSYPATTRSSYAGQPASSASSRLSTSATMSYPSYTQPPLNNPYRGSIPSRSPSQYGKPAILMAWPLTPPSRRRLNAVGYTNPSTGASMSRSMSGPSLPSMPPRTYEEVRNVGREFVERRRRTANKPRRERKILLRQAALPSALRPLQAQDVSGSIDSFLAHPTSSFESNNPPYAMSASQGAYSSGATRSSSSYDPVSYPAGYGTSSGGSATYVATSRGYPGASTSAYDYSSESRRPSEHGTAEPVVIETPAKPQCWDHGCNGRQFSTFSNLLRHQREKSGSSTKSVCHRCGAEFTRKTARDGHLAHDKCKQKSPGR